jgi:aerobic-type carbon monoxide dehydrogenase small subunit (CoxS/CutS family)
MTMSVAMTVNGKSVSGTVEARTLLVSSCARRWA